MGCTSGLLVKVLACNRKVAGSNPTKVQVFFTHEYTQLHPQNELATCAIPASSLATFG